MSFGQFNTEMRESEKEKEKGIGEPANHPPSSAMDQL